MTIDKDGIKEEKKNEKEKKTKNKKTKQQKNFSDSSKKHETLKYIFISLKSCSVFYSRLGILKLMSIACLTISEELRKTPTEGTPPKRPRSLVRQSALTPTTNQPSEKKCYRKILLGLEGISVSMHCARFFIVACFLKVSDNRAMHYNIHSIFPYKTYIL